MNKELAEMYGNDTESVEKVASAQLAEALSDEGSIDLKGLSVEQLEELAKSVMAADESAEETEETEETEEQAEEVAEETEEVEATEEKTAEAEDLTDEDKQKLAEADYLGRVMAHSFKQEQREIEKQAGMKDKAGKVGSKLKELAGKAKTMAGAHGKKVTGVAAGAAGFGAGRLSKKGKDKKGSATPAIDALAEARVTEILAANGIKPEVTEKTAAPEDKELALANAVEARAVELLKERGYEIVAEEETPAAK